MSTPAINALKEAHYLLTSVLEDKNFTDKIEQAAKLLSSTISSDHRVLSCGNGGSMCDATHFAEELTGRYRKDRRALPAMSLADPAHMSCVANDFGYEYIFSRMVESWGSKGDMLIAISTSGNSPNVINAVKAAKDKGMNVVGLLGKGGGKLESMCDVSLVVPSQTTERIQEIHIKIIHIMIECMERDIFPEHYQS
jgi:D-sedoheptulose 7-phosphate isomerase